MYLAAAVAALRSSHAQSRPAVAEVALKMIRNLADANTSNQAMLGSADACTGTVTDSTPSDSLALPLSHPLTSRCSSPVVRMLAALKLMFSVSRFFEISAHSRVFLFHALDSHIHKHTHIHIHTYIHTHTHTA